MMTTTCDWCGAPIRAGDATTIVDALCSHRICRDCLGMIVAELSAEDATRRQKAQDYLTAYTQAARDN